MRILLAFDGSPGSRAAADELCRRLWPSGSELRIVTVLPFLDPYLNGVGSFPATSACEFFLKEQGKEAVELQGTLAAEIERRTQGLAVSRVLLEGRPTEVIVDEAKRWGADLVVLGCNGYGAVGRLLLGSVSLAVAMNAPCSVEVVRRRPGTEDAGEEDEPGFGAGS